MPTANITIIIGKSKRRRSFFSYAQHQGRRIRHYGLTVLICFSVAPDYVIREILPDGLCPSGAAAGPLALDYCLAGISTHSPPRPACPLGVRCSQTEASEPWAWGCMQGMSARGCQQGMSARDVCNGISAMGYLQWDTSKGCGHGCVICLWSSARCVSGGHVLIARHAVLPHCNMLPQHSHHHSPRSLWLSLCHRPATV